MFKLTQMCTTQRKFREADEEESYFDSDDEGAAAASAAAINSSPDTAVAPSADEVAGQEGDPELHITPRTFPLSQAPLLDSDSGALRAEQHRRGNSGLHALDDDNGEVDHGVPVGSESFVATQDRGSLK
jgi:hypothetical protein